MALKLSTFIPIIKEMVYHISIDDYASIEHKGQNGDILIEDLASKCGGRPGSCP